MSDLQLVPGNSLLTATPEEGRQLAVKLARLVIKLTSPMTKSAASSAPSTRIIP